MNSFAVSLSASLQQQLQLKKVFVDRGEMASSGIRVVGVVGAGQMGSGIAQVAAAAQLQVIMADVDEAAVGRGMRAITSSLARFVKKQTLSQVLTAHPSVCLLCTDPQLELQAVTLNWVLHS